MYSVYSPVYTLSPIFAFHYYLVNQLYCDFRFYETECSYTINFTVIYSTVLYCSGYIVCLLLSLTFKLTLPFQCIGEVFHLLTDENIKKINKFGARGLMDYTLNIEKTLITIIIYLSIY